MDAGTQAGRGYSDREDRQARMDITGTHAGRERLL
jgi:hypothetical protein